MKASILLVLTLGAVVHASQAQTIEPDWFTSAFLGSLWRSERPMPLGDSSFVEPGLRPLLPPIALNDLRYARHPDGTPLAQRLAQKAGLPDPLPYDPARAIETDSLLALLATRAAASVDVASYLRIRLFDHLIGDWSRTKESLVWHPQNSPMGEVWRPVPRPFLNPFTRYDGLLPGILLQMSDYMTSWSNDPTSSLRPGNPLRVLDRRFLSSSPWPVWDSVTADLRARLHPAVIGEVCAPVPAPDKGMLSADLNRRVMLLPVMSQQMHRNITRFVEFHSNGHADSVFIRILSRRALEVSVHGDGSSTRLLNSLATQEVRFLMTNDSNSVWIEGPDQLSFDLIVDIGESTAAVWHRRHPLLPWTRGAPGGVRLFTTPVSASSDQGDDAWGQRVTFVPWLDANRDDHLFLGGGPEITTSAYRAFPYATRALLMAGFATRTERFRVLGSFETRTLVRGMGIGLDAHYSQLNISNFFGRGNETEAPKDLLSRSYFKADQRLFELTAPVRAYVSDMLSFGLLPTLHILRTDPRPGSLIDSLISAGYARRLNYTSIRLEALYDSRDRSAIPTRGMFASAAVAWTPKTLQNDHSFTTLHLDSRYYHYLGAGGMHLLIRTTGTAVIGEHPWFASAFIGGSQSLRGFERQRFAGDASVTASAEWRVPLGRLNLFWPFDIGGLIFTETGRVFADGERSTRWHSSAGAGAWFHPARSPYSVVITVAASQELVEFLATFGVPIR